MTRREVIAYAITHAPKGVKGGPYEGAGGLRQTAPTLALAHRYRDAEDASLDATWLRNNGYTARVIRIVRARPSEASAVEVLRELVAAATQLAGETPLPRANVVCSLSCFAEEVRRTRVALDRARAVLAASGPDPMPVVRAAMAYWVTGGSMSDGPLLDAVDTYRKAGGK